jgi:hypothetical protein
VNFCGENFLAPKLELTTNEVKHAEDFQPTDLIVVDGIHYKRGPDDKFHTAGGPAPDLVELEACGSRPLATEVRVQPPVHVSASPPISRPASLACGKAVEVGGREPWLTSGL